MRKGDLDKVLEGDAVEARLEVVEVGLVVGREELGDDGLESADGARRAEAGLPGLRLVEEAGDGEELVQGDRLRAEKVVQGRPEGGRDAGQLRLLQPESQDVPRWRQQPAQTQGDPGPMLPFRGKGERGRGGGTGSGSRGWGGGRGAAG